MQEILSITPAQQTVLDEIHFVESTEKVEHDSQFQAFALEVEDVEQVQGAYLKLTVALKNATHIAMAFHLDVDGETITGGQSDGEYQAETKLMDVLFQMNVTNISVFITRWYSGVCLGGLKLSLMQQCAREVLANFQHLVKLKSNGNDSDTSPAESDNENNHEDKGEDDDKSSTAGRGAFQE